MLDILSFVTLKFSIVEIVPYLRNWTCVLLDIARLAYLLPFFLDLLYVQVLARGGVICNSTHLVLYTLKIFFFKFFLFYM